MDEQLPLFPTWPILADSELMAVLRNAQRPLPDGALRIVAQGQKQDGDPAVQA
jgi:hypothetical protein